MWSNLFSGFIGSLITSIIVFLLSYYQTKRQIKLSENKEEQRRKRDIELRENEDLKNFYFKFYGLRMALQNNPNKDILNKWTNLANEVPIVFRNFPNVVNAYNDIVNNSDSKNLTQSVIHLYECMYDSIKRDNDSPFDQKMLEKFLT